MKVMIKSMIRRLNSALPALLLGILIYGVIVELAGVWFVEDKLRYSTGLWIGIALACGMAIHMAVVIEDAVALQGENGAKNKVILQSLLRYIVVVAVFFVTAKFRLGNFIMAFIGVLGLKAAAYMQPFIHKVLYLKEGKDQRSSDSTEL